VNKPKPDAAATATIRRGGRIPWQLLSLLVAMHAVGPTSLTIIVPSIPAMAVSLATDASVVQLTISLYLVCLAFAQLLLGSLSDRFGRRPVILAGLALMAITSFAAMAATSAAALIAARSAQAFGASSGMVVGRAMIRDLYERDRAAAMIGLVTMTTIVVPMLAPLLGGILDTAFGWRAIFVFLGAMSAAVLLWAFLALPETRPERHTNGPRPHFLKQAGSLLSGRSFLGYVLCGSLGCGAFFTFLGGGSHVVVSIMGRSSAEFGVWFAVTSFGYMLGNLATARYSQRFGVDAMIRWGLILEVVGTIITLAVAVLAPEVGPAPIFLPQLIIQVGNGMLLPNAIAGAVSVRPQAAGTAAGIVGFAQMALGATAAQGITYFHIGAVSAIPLAVTMLAWSAVALAAYYALVHPRRDAVST
jgi:DHA1 family bicyclomycin/chloramphenicol resistance-like MFS transporter